MRAFIALPPSERAHDALLALSDELRRVADRQHLSGRWVVPEQLHVTVKFLGDVDPTTIAGFRDVVAGCARGRRPIETTLSAVGAFGPPRRARVLVVNVADEEGLLRAIAAEIEDAAVALGVPKETRAFVPHVTLARFRDGADATKLLSHHVTPIPCVFDRVQLYESVLTPRGSAHRLLFESRFTDS